MAQATDDTTTAPSTAFTLGDPELSAIKGRITAQPGKFLTEVRGAIENPTMAFGILITDENKDKTIVNQLQKSATQLGVKLRIYSRPNYIDPNTNEPRPFVGFQFKDTATPAA